LNKTETNLEKILMYYYQNSKFQTSFIQLIPESWYIDCTKCK